MPLSIFKNPTAEKDQASFEVYTQFINWVSASSLDEKTKQDAFKVITCLKFIKYNLEAIGEFIDNKEKYIPLLNSKDQTSQVIRDFEGTSLHFNAYNTGEQAKKDLTAFIVQFENAIQAMTELGQLEGFTKALKYDKKIGCIEARTEEAILFAKKKSSENEKNSDDEVLILPDLFAEIYKKFSPDDVNANYQLVYKHFREKGYLGKLCIYENKLGTKPPEILSKELIDKYMLEILCEEITDKDKAEFFEINQPIGIVESSGSYIFNFKAEADAQIYLDRIKSYAFDIDDDSIERVEVIKEKDAFSFNLNEKQFTYLKAQYEKWKAFPDSEIYFIKSLRGDFLNFFYDFIQGITGSSKRIPLRQGKTMRYTVKATGIEDRDTRMPQYSAEQKQGFSKFQSTTLVTDKVSPPLFTFRSDASNKQLAFIFDLKDALINRLYIYDGGTVNRPYDFWNEADAKRYFDQKVKGKNPLLFSDLAEFEKYLVLSNHKINHNEVLARLRWNTDGTSKLAIINNTLEARWLAQAYAQSLAKRLQQRNIELGKPTEAVSPYSIPICYYQPGNSLHNHFYDVFEQMIDRTKAIQIYQNDSLRCNEYDKGSYEFLLMLEPKQIVNALQEIRDDGTVLLFEMIASGYMHIAELLLEKIEDTSFINHLIDNANPHEEENCLPAVLFFAAKYNRLDLVNKLISQNVPVAWQGNYKNTALHQAIIQSNDEILTALLNAADAVTALAVGNDQSYTPIEQAAVLKRWDIVKQIAEKYRTDSDDTLHYGSALLDAIQADTDEATEAAKALLAAGASLTWTKNNTGNGALHLAIKKGNDVVLTTLLNAADAEKALAFKKALAVKNKESLTPIQQAGRKNQWDIVKKIAEKYRTDSDDTLHYGSALLDAIQADTDEATEAAKALLAADVPLELDKYYEALNSAFTANNHEILPILYKYLDTKLRKLCKYNLNSLIENLVIKKEWGLLQQLIEKANLSYIDNIYTVKPHTYWEMREEISCGNALAYAIQNNSFKMVEFLFKVKHYITCCVPGTGNKPLHLACEQGNQEILDFLLSSENNLLCNLHPTEGIRGVEDEEFFKAWERVAIDLADQNINNETPIVVAARHGHWELVKKLADRFKTNESDNLQYGSALSYAVKANRADVVKVLLKQGAPPITLSDDTPNPVLEMAFKENSTEIINALLSSGNLNQHTPIQHAAKYGHWQIVKKIAEKYPTDREDTLHYGSALLYAIAANQTEVAKALLAAGARSRWNMINTGNGPLHLAIEQGNRDIVEAILEQRNNLAFQHELIFKNKNGLTPIELAVTLKYWDVVEKIAGKYNTDNTESNDNLNYGDALLLAIKESEIEGVNALSKVNASKAWLSTDGDTLLHVAIYKRNPAIIGALLDAAFSLTHKNKLNQTPLQLLVELAANDAQFKPLIAKIQAKQDAILSSDADGVEKLGQIMANMPINPHYPTPISQKNVTDAAKKLLTEINKQLSSGAEDQGLKNLAFEAASFIAKPNQDSLKKLVENTQLANGKASNKIKLSGLLTALIGAVILAVCLAGAIPSGGLSLFGTTVGYSLLAAGVGGTAMAAGAITFWAGREKGAAKIKTDLVDAVAQSQKTDAECLSDLRELR